MSAEARRLLEIRAYLMAGLANTVTLRAAALCALELTDTPVTVTVPTASGIT